MFEPKVNKLQDQIDRLDINLRAVEDRLIAIEHATRHDSYTEFQELVTITLEEYQELHDYRTKYENLLTYIESNHLT